MAIQNGVLLCEARDLRDSILVTRVSRHALFQSFFALVALTIIDQHHVMYELTSSHHPLFLRREPDSRSTSFPCSALSSSVRLHHMARYALGGSSMPLPRAPQNAFPAHLVHPFPCSPPSSGVSLGASHPKVHERTDE